MTVHIFPSFDIAVATIGGGSGSGCAGHSCGAVPCKMQKMRLAVGCGLSRSGKILTGNWKSKHKTQQQNSSLSSCPVVVGWVVVIVGVVVVCSGRE